MNALVKKEIRLLLPNLLIGCALALANLMFRFNPDGSLTDGWWFVLAFVACGAMAVMLALNSFGAEISAGTFSNLLTQPIPRRQIWQTKVLLLAAALFLFGLFWSACGLARLILLGRDLHLGDLITGVGTFGLVVFSGGLWTVLLLRQVAAAFWFTLLTPGAIWVLVASLWPDKYAAGLEPAVITALLAYSLAGFWFARRLFLRAQDVAWTGGTIALPEMRGLARFKLNSGIRRRWRPRAALQRKEFQLHLSQLVMAGVLALLHLGVLAARHFGNFQKNSSLEFVLESFWMLWLVMPMLVGCAAAAEERKLGTHEGQFCLPVQRRTQFVAKAWAVLLLSLLFGVVMPLLLEGNRVLPNLHSDFGPITAMLDVHGATNWQMGMSTAQIFFWNCFGSVLGLLPLLTWAAIAAAIGLISFYASTLSRNTLQALAPAVLGLLLTWFLIFLAARPDELGLNFGIHLPWRGVLIYFIGVPMLTLTVLALASWNYGRLLLNGQVWLRNALTLLVMLGLVAVATTAIYHRVWEKLTPFEPPHRAARLSREQPPVMNDQWSSLSVRLPDGRIWTDDYSLNSSRPNPLALLLGNLRLTPQGGGHFYAGSNWVTVVGTPRRELAGIKADGTLWVSAKPAHRERLTGGGWRMTQAGDFVRVGTDTNWNSLLWRGNSILLVKDDGTLWRWGATNWNYKLHEWPGFATFTPKRLGTATNWAEAFMTDFQLCLRKTDGTVWTTWNSGGTKPETILLEPGFSVERAAYLERGRWRGTTKSWGGMQYLAVRDDGTFRIRADQKFNQESHNYDWTSADWQLGDCTNWLAVAGHGEKIATLKDDGTLWVWNFYHHYWRGWDTEREMLSAKPTRLGTHADWLAIASAEGGIISLAADGSLWYWPLESTENYAAEHGIRNNNNSFEPLLDISRKPQKIGNIFDAKTEGSMQPTANFSSVAGVAFPKPPRIPVPANAPIDVSILNVSNAPDGSQVAWYCVSNHTASGIVLLSDSNSLPCYSLDDYSFVDAGGAIHVTNYNLVSFSSVRPASLPAHAIKSFPVHFPAGVTNAMLCINYLRQKSDREVKQAELASEFRIWVGLETSAPKSEPYINYPLPFP